jgi:hypothetical protein
VNRMIEQDLTRWQTLWQNFHTIVWKIFVWSEIPTRPPTENLVQVCITLPFFGSSGTSLLVNCGNPLASVTRSSVVRSQADLLSTPSHASV